eukprot:gene24939-10593_t
MGKSGVAKHSSVPATSLAQASSPSPAQSERPGSSEGTDAPRRTLGKLFCKLGEKLRLKRAPSLPLHTYAPAPAPAAVTSAAVILPEERVWYRIYRLDGHQTERDWTSAETKTHACTSSISAVRTPVEPYPTHSAFKSHAQMWPSSHDKNRTSGGGLPPTILEGYMSTDLTIFPSISISTIPSTNTMSSMPSSSICTVPSSSSCLSSLPACRSVHLSTPAQSSGHPLASSDLQAPDFPPGTDRRHSEGQCNHQADSPASLVAFPNDRLSLGNPTVRGTVHGHSTSTSQRHTITSNPSRVSSPPPLPSDQPLPINPSLPRAQPSAAMPFRRTSHLVLTGPISIMELLPPPQEEPSVCSSASNLGDAAAAVCGSGGCGGVGTDLPPGISTRYPTRGQDPHREVGAEGVEGNRQVRSQEYAEVRDEVPSTRYPTHYSTGQELLTTQPHSRPDLSSLGRRNVERHEQRAPEKRGRIATMQRNVQQYLKSMRGLSHTHSEQEVGAGKGAQIKDPNRQHVDPAAAVKEHPNSDLRSSLGPWPTAAGGGLPSTSDPLLTAGSTRGSWPSAAGRGLPCTSDPLLTAGSTRGTWPTAAGGGLPSTSDPLLTAGSTRDSWPSAAGRGVPNTCDPLLTAGPVSTQQPPPSNSKTSTSLTLDGPKQGVEEGASTITISSFSVPSAPSPAYPTYTSDSGPPIKYDTALSSLSMFSGPSTISSLRSQPHSCTSEFPPAKYENTSSALSCFSNASTYFSAYSQASAQGQALFCRTPGNTVSRGPPPPLLAPVSRSSSGGSTSSGSLPSPMAGAPPLKACLPQESNTPTNTLTLLLGTERPKLPRPPSAPAHACGPPSTSSGPDLVPASGSPSAPATACGPPSTSSGPNPVPKPETIVVSACLPYSMMRPAWRMEDYSDLKKLHSGYASSVYSAMCAHSGQKVVLKVYKPHLLHVMNQHHLLREARIHVSLNHPNIIKLFAAFKQGDQVVLVQEYANGGDLMNLLLGREGFKLAEKEAGDQVVLVQEYADGGDLMNLLLGREGFKLAEKEAVCMVVQPLLSALVYLHNRGVVHRDVKHENVLFVKGEDGMQLKLGDFGLSINVREERPVTRAGTLDYMVLKCPNKSSPEENKQQEDLAYTCSVDVWSTAAMAYELLTGMPPFGHEDRCVVDSRHGIRAVDGHASLWS